MLTLQSGRTVRATSADRRSTDLNLWWLSPVVVSLFIGTSAIVLTAFVNDEQFRTYWDEPKLVTTDTLILFECGVIAFAFGALITRAWILPKGRSTETWPRLPPVSRTVLKRASTILTTMTAVGYAGFILLIAQSGLTISELFGGSDNPWDAPVKTELGNIPFVTSLTQVGIAAVAVSAVLLACEYSRAELIKLVIVIALSILRAYIYSERLALLELVVPVLVVGAAWLSMQGGLRRRIARVIPIIGIVMVVVVFAVFEYFRSWMFYRMHGESSFPVFVLNRLAGYYATAINNGQVILSHLRWPGRLPYDTLENFWSVQGVYQLRLYEVLGGHDRPYAKSGGNDSPYFDALSNFANPEFNNPSGYVAPFVDYGRIGGLIFFFLLGVLAAILYHQFCKGGIVGLLVYPVFFTGLVEWPRYMYWVQARCTYAWLSLVLVLIAVGIARHRVARRGRGQRGAIGMRMRRFGVEASSRPNRKDDSCAEEQHGLPLRS